MEEVADLGVFEACDERLSRLSDALGPYLREAGSRITGRTNLMVRQTFSGPEEEAVFQALEEPGGKDREMPAGSRSGGAWELRFMSLVQRRRVCMMHFIGPRESKLRLLPRDGRPPIELVVGHLGCASLR